MNSLKDIVGCFGFLALVWWLASPLVEQEARDKKLCMEKGGAYVSIPHTQAYCAPKIKLKP